MRSKLTLLAALIAVHIGSPAFAHTGIGSTSAFTSGVAHPLGGLDHMLGMVAVGLWGGLRGGRARWLWPLCFVASMILGGGLGMEGVPLPFVEQGILGSILVLGLAVAFAVKAPLAVGGFIIAMAGILHGHAHGAEAPLDASGLDYALGFVMATAALHAAGVGATVLALRFGKPALIRAAGIATAAAGLVLAFAGA